MLERVASFRCIVPMKRVPAHAPAFTWEFGLFDLLVANMLERVAPVSVYCPDEASPCACACVYRGEFGMSSLFIVNMLEQLSALRAGAPSLGGFRVCYGAGMRFRRKGRAMAKRASMGILVLAIAAVLAFAVGCASGSGSASSSASAPASQSSSASASQPGQASASESSSASSAQSNSLTVAIYPYMPNAEHFKQFAPPRRGGCKNERHHSTPL